MGRVQTWSLVSFWTAALVVIVLLLAFALTAVVLAPMVAVFVAIEWALYWVVTRAAIAADAENGKRLHRWPDVLVIAVVAGIGLVIAALLVFTGLWLATLYGWLAGMILGAVGMVVADADAWKATTTSALACIDALFAWDRGRFSWNHVLMLAVLALALLQFFWRIRGEEARIARIERRP